MELTDKQRLAKLEEAERLLKQTKAGYPGAGKGTFWKPAMALLDEVEASLRPKPTPPLVFPIATEKRFVTVGGIHQTAGDTGFSPNMARDFICKAGLGIVAPEAALITRFSGHDPSDDQADRDGVYGWSTHMVTPAGYHYFITHQGRRYPTLRPGMRVQAGDLIGYVGDQRFRADHAHIGVTSPKGRADGERRINAVAAAPVVS